MSLPINISDLLSGRSIEWERLEFKEGWNPQDILHTLCAFANDFHNLGGGYLFLGVAEKDGQPVLPPTGIRSSQIDKMQKDILNLGHKIIPRYHPIVAPYIVDDKHVLVLWALGGENRPYKAPVSLSKNNKDYGYYIRKMSSTVRASPDEEVELLNLSAKIPFDDRINQRAEIGDLKLSFMQAHLREVGSELFEASVRMKLPELCKRMRIVDGPSEYLRPRNVGLMFFNESPEQFFPETKIDIVRFPDGTGGDVILERSFTGPIGRQAKDALSFLQNNVIQEIVRKRPDRAEADRFFNYPYSAVEEALVNAIYHRSYEEREPIELRILPDHMTITSYPGPDRSISIEDLESGEFIARRYRNRRIGEFLKELGLTEGRGTGVPKIIRAMRSNGSPAPQFKTDEGRTYFVTILPIHPEAVLQVQQVTGQVGQVTGQVEIQLPLVLDNTNLQLLEFCLEPRSRQEMQDYLGLSSRHSFRVSRLVPLLDANLLEMTEPNAPRSPTQKYRTTLQGEEFLKDI